MRFEWFAQVRGQGFPHLLAGGTVQHQPKGAFGIVLTNEQDCPVKKRALETSVVQQQLTLQRFESHQDLAATMSQTGAHDKPNGRRFVRMFGGAIAAINGCSPLH
jgi:folate-dependent phosphoribosylglycinamide formyltransferase PurN